MEEREHTVCRLMTLTNLDLGLVGGWLSSTGSVHSFSVFRDAEENDVR